MLASRRSRATRAPAKLACRSPWHLEDICLTHNATDWSELRYSTCWGHSATRSPFDLGEKFPDGSLVSRSSMKRTWKLFRKLRCSAILLAQQPKHPSRVSRPSTPALFSGHTGLGPNLGDSCKSQKKKERQQDFASRETCGVFPS